MRGLRSRRIYAAEKSLFRFAGSENEQKANGKGGTPRQAICVVLQVPQRARTPAVARRPDASRYLTPETGLDF